ncbi:RNA/RNP complex-1-interacting phosphatase-like [Myripristis murdjan]|uniref:RNA/RNP complex-1-interacting phosphatase n=1 Tax=Myripristis murdjan TaxID=586833 RepID=A0A667ZXV5_9TELE|nr:RNA/RNP complex-1-interacting phosphatase-like [Myripristis murdjan]
MPPCSKRNGIPDRWMDYKAVGKRLPGTRFIAFKVPLKQSLNRHLPCSEAFGPWELLETLRKDNEELGLIIDLTFTTRYYKLEDLPDSLMCVKIFTAGHEIPSDATILSFKRAVHRFLQDNADNDKLIGIHCTHGLNRTGYLVCRYLIDVDGMDPKEAVELFNSSRGHDIERQNYLEDLQSGPKRSNEGIEESDQEPKRGHAVHRPCYTPFDADTREERRPHVNDRYHRGHYPPRGMKHQSHHWLPHGGHPPDGLLLPHRPLPPPAGPLFHPYRWTPPHPDNQWGRQLQPNKTWHRNPLPEREWTLEERGRGPCPPAPHYSDFSRSFNAGWTSKPNSHNPPEEWKDPRMKSRHRYSHKQREDAYRNHY